MAAWRNGSASDSRSGGWEFNSLSESDGDYHPITDVPAYLYVLVYENAREINDPDPYPGRDFADNLFFVRDYQCKLPKFPQMDLDEVI
ncbi:hypothetical protein PVAND_017829 [Polypedilum vanderplanki]|uniref:Uncharacterized protein n=1 Tax=Polypedilum vanderplanki TaxID=319348 RepID=A0A9J6B9C8_POLVA|nr:hypothetical protein PVAND_017829 [Polypedilum vanderplanki]